MFPVGKPRGYAFMMDLTMANTPSPRRTKFALSILFLLLVFAVGCMRFNMSLVVEESVAGSPTAEMKVRTLFSPSATATVGELLGFSLESWYESGEQNVSFDPPLEGAIWPASDSDGWEGIAYDVRGSLEDVLAIETLSQMEDMVPQAADGSLQEDDSGLKLDKTDNRWNFTWQVEGLSDTSEIINQMEADLSEVEEDIASDFIDQMEADLSEVGEDITSGFEFDLSVSLPGELVETNSTDISSSLDSTTARWKVTELTAALDFVLITETGDPSESTDGEEDSGGLGIAWVLTIAFIGIALITLFFFRIDRKVSV